MADDKGSDLDIFEGLTKKKKPQPSVPEAGPGSSSGTSAPPPSSVQDSGFGMRESQPVSTMRSGLASSRGLPPAKPPPPKKKTEPPPSAPGAADGGVLSAPSLPKPNLPPERKSSRADTPPPRPQVDSVPDFIAEATSEMARPSKEELDRASAKLLRGDTPHRGEAAEAEMELSAESLPSEAVEEVRQQLWSQSVLPGQAAADLDWDDEEESTSVFDKSNADLFGSLTGRAADDPDDTARRDVSKAAALLAGSGRQASMAPVAGPAPIAPAVGPGGGHGGGHPLPGAFDSMPRIPAPAPVPRDISEAAGFHPSPPPPRGVTPSWAPSVPPAAREASGSKSVWILVAVALVVVGVAGFFYMKTTGPGTLKVRVTHNDKPVDTGQVYLDGRPVDCKFLTPCVIADVKPGPHEVRVTSAALAGRAELTVKGGSETDVVVQLGVSNDTAPPADSNQPAADASKPAGLSMKTSMAEKIKVFVDGKEHGTLPVELKDLKPGKVTLRFETTGDKYGKLEKTVELKPGETFKLDDVKLPLKQVAVTFKLETAGATVKLVQDGKTDVPLTFTGDKADKKLDTTSTWKIVATLKGYKDFDQTIAFEEGKAEQSISIKLEKAEEATAKTADPVTSNTGSVPPPPPPAEDTGFGMINANSLPPSAVLIDGKPHGQTPVTGVKVSVGSHTVVFKHKDFGVQSRSATVTAGKTTTVSVKFDVKSGGGDDEKPKRKKKKSDDD